MKNIHYFILIALILMVAGCGEEHGDPVGPYPTTAEGIAEEYLIRGWEAFNAGTYDLASNRFDSALTWLSSYKDAHLGKGYTELVQSPEDEAKLDECYNEVRFCLYEDGQKPTVDLWDTTVVFLGLNDDGGYVLGTFNDINGLLRPEAMMVQPTDSSYWEYDSLWVTFIDTVNQETVTTLFVDSNLIELTDTFTMEITGFTDANTIWTEPIEESGGGIYYPDSLDLFYASYTTKTSAMSVRQALSYAAIAQLRQVSGKSSKEDLLESMSAARAYMDDYGYSNPLPSSVLPDTGVALVEKTDSIALMSTGVTTRKVGLTLAQSYFYAGYYRNCMAEVEKLDTNDVYSFDPESESFIYNLQQALQDLQE